MSKTKRLRVFAGPNGSGKSTLIEDIKQRFNTGFIINSDVVEKEIVENGFVNLENFNLSLQQRDFDSFCKTKDALSLIKRFQDSGNKIEIEIKENVIVHQTKKTHSYEAALITSFIRSQLIVTGQSFSFETVMSHISKLNEIEAANKQGYKTYLYFVCLDDLRINVSRVKNRMVKGGHRVEESKIVHRYYQTLENLPSAIRLAGKSYLFDNSDEMKLIAEIKNEDELLVTVCGNSLPEWFVNYVANNLLKQ